MRIQQKVAIYRQINKNNKINNNRATNTINLSNVQAFIGEDRPSAISK